MSIETVTLKFVNQPKQQGWKGSIVDTQDRRISVEPSDLALFQPGGTYSIMTSHGVTQQGKPYIKFVGMGAPGGAPAQQTQATPRTNGNGYAKPQGEARMIFITGVVGRAMGSGNFSIGDIVALTINAAEAYDALTLGHDLAPGARNERNPPPYDDANPF